MRREWSVGAATQGARGRIVAHERELRRMRGRGGLHCITCVVHWTRAVCGLPDFDLRLMALLSGATYLVMR